MHRHTHGQNNWTQIHTNTQIRGSCIHTFRISWKTVKMTCHCNFFHWEMLWKCKVECDCRPRGWFGLFIKICITSFQLTRYLEGKWRRSALYHRPRSICLWSTEASLWRVMLSVFSTRPASLFDSCLMVSLCLSVSEPHSVSASLNASCTVSVVEILLVSVFHDLFPPRCTKFVCLVSSSSWSENKWYYLCHWNRTKTHRNIVSVWSLTELTEETASGRLFSWVSSHVVTSYSPIKINAATACGFR